MDHDEEPPPTTPDDPAFTFFCEVVGFTPEMEAEAAARLAAVAEHRDEAAFAALFRGCGPRLVAFLVRRGTPAGAVDEVIQETFAELWRRADEFDPATMRAPFWVYSVARHVATLHQYDDAERNSMAALLVRAEKPPTRPDEVLDRRTDMALMREALAKLPPEQAELLRLNLIEGLGPAKIARLKNLTVDTVKGRMNRALATLRAHVRPK